MSLDEWSKSEPKKPAEPLSFWLTNPPGSRADILSRCLDPEYKKARDAMMMANPVFRKLVEEKDIKRCPHCLVAAVKHVIDDSGHWEWRCNRCTWTEFNG